MSGISALLRETPESSLVSSAKGGYREKRTVYVPGGGHTRKGMCWCVDLPLQQPQPQVHKRVLPSFVSLDLHVVRYWTTCPELQFFLFPNKPIFMEKYLTIGLRSAVYLAHQNNVFVN